ncbi:uncharacterized protein LOC104903530 isoform X3 [Beta vulgaris subsp. vulgaris]|uniref:uncharacterized protein LOC104903530 isoform X3 n=1 Tax=Beta vulgaris subsp. vulgaris TaxID=3555 RepID=UPI002036D0F9|nr:uncharacterized protein LOC104903530 isoform X3 [Beta vulgaris subsp. vulgaris]
MVIMDFKGVSWVGDVYQKFEAMCVEAEEIICEDTFKYVENRVRTVGKTVKKFYADVVEDLVPPSSLDPVEAEDCSLTLAHHGDVQICQNREVDDKAMNYAGERCAKENCQSHGSDLVLSNQATSVAKETNSINDSQNKSLANLSSINATVTNNSAQDGTFIELPTANDELSSLHGDASSKEGPEVSHNEEDGVGISGEMVEGYRVGDFIEEKMTRMLSGGRMSTDLDRRVSTDFDETSNPFLGFQVDEQLNEVRLEESCVLVDKNDKVFKLALEDAQKSYKKKIQDVLSTRRWSKSKQNQEQLLAWYVEQIETNLACTSMIHPERQKSQTSESFESDWELL